MAHKASIFTRLLFDVSEYLSHDLIDSLNKSCKMVDSNKRSYCLDSGSAKILFTQIFSNRVNRIVKKKRVDINETLVRRVTASSFFLSGKENSFLGRVV